MTWWQENKSQLSANFRHCTKGVKMNTFRICSVLLFLSVVVGAANGAVHVDHDNDHKEEHAGIDIGCPEIEYQYGERKYIEYLPSIPELREATLCWFATTNDQGIIPGVVASYGTKKNPRLIVITGVLDGGTKMIHLVVGDTIRYQLRAPLSANTEHHVCITIRTHKSEVSVYFDGKPEMTYVSTYLHLKPFPTGGTLLIGKALHDDSLFFTGKIRNFMMWARVLQPSTIARIYNANKCPGDEAVVLRPGDLIFHGTFVRKKECLGSDYTFNNQEGSVEYVKILSTVPEMKFSTRCVWVTADETGGIPGTVGSYTIGDQLDVMLIEGTRIMNVNYLRIAINGEVHVIPLEFEPLTEHFVCLHHYIERKITRLYVDTEFVNTAKYKKIGPKTSQGGISVFGQRQGCNGGCFDKKRAYNGRMRDFTVWGRILTSEEMTSIYEDNLCPLDTIQNINPKNVLPEGKFFPSEDCPGIEYDFNNRGHAEYLRLCAPFPRLDFFTICFTATTNAKGMVRGTIMSYALEEPDVLVIRGAMLYGMPVLQITLHGQTEDLKYQLKSNMEHKFCIRFHTTTREVYAFVDGKQVAVMQYKSSKGIPGGGNLIIGQSQTCYKEDSVCLHKEDAYNGNIKDFMIWDRALSDSEIKSIKLDSQCPANAAITLDPPNVIPFGKFFESQACPSTDFTLRNKQILQQYVEVTKQFQLEGCFTVCTKIITGETAESMSGTIVSYATDEVDAFSMSWQKGNRKAKLQVSISEQVEEVPVKFSPDTEYGLCFVFSLHDNRVHTYINGQLKTEIEFSSLGTFLAPGKLIIGQQQMCRGACFDRESAFNGRIRKFMIWDRALSGEEIEAYSKSDQCPISHIVDLTMADAKFVWDTI